MSARINTATVIISSLCLMLTVTGYAANSVFHFDNHPERGWYFYQQELTVPLKASVTKPAVNRPVTPLKQNPCAIPDKWTAQCGFVNPTTVGLPSKAAFGFEQEEYHTLMQNFSLYPNNIRAVLNFQKFNMWALNSAMTASYTWQYNMLQHPGLNANVQVPVSRFGLALIKHIELQGEKNFWAMLSKTAFFVLITRSNEPTCEAQGNIARMLARQTGVTVWNFSIDHGHLPGFKHYMTLSMLSTKVHDAVLKNIRMNWLPVMYLYLKPVQAGAVGRWIIVASGVTPLSEIENRTINFVEAYRHAIVVGAGEDRHLVPDFSVDHLDELADEQLGLTNKTITQQQN